MNEWMNEFPTPPRILELEISYYIILRLTRWRGPEKSTHLLTRALMGRG